MILSLILGFLLGVAALLFALQNTAVVELSFMGWQFESSLALLILMAFAAGIIVSLLVSIPSAVKDSFRIMSLKKENRKLVDEVNAHRQANQTVVTVVDDTIPQVLDIRNQ